MPKSPPRMQKDFFYPKKSLGQSFLKSKKIAERLVSALPLEKGDLVLEIGPGKGILTEFLVKYPVRVIGIEIDTRLVLFLRERFKDFPNLIIIQGDILKYDFPEEGMKIIGNIPFSLSSPLLFHLFAHWPKWQVAVLTFQREFSRRLLAEPKSKEYSALTLISSLYVEKERLFSIPRRFFKPEPKVESESIILYRREKPLFLEEHPEFINFLKAVFAHRRKTLLNNLVEYLHRQGEEGATLRLELKKVLEERGFSDCRAEDLRLEEFKEVYDALKRL